MIPIKTLVNNLDESIFVFDRHGSLAFMNKTAEEFFGKGFKEIGKKRFQELFSRTKDIVMLIQKTLQQGRSFNCREMEVDIGRPVTVDLHLCPLYVDNSLEGAILCTREHFSITEQDDYQFDSLLYLLGSIAHEIRNPLSGIKGAAQLLKRRNLDEESTECISHIAKEADRLNAILQGYLTMTRKPVFNQVNIHEVIEHALKVLNVSIKEKKISIGKFYDPSLPNVSGDESKLLQVLINLLKNAMEAMDGVTTQRTIGITTRPSTEYRIIYEKDNADKKHAATKKQRWIIITIKDNGKGISKEELEKIFLPFYTRKKGGSGLGLTLSKKIVKDHGGIIKAKSKVGSGTVFSLCLPYK